MLARVDRAAPRAGAWSGADRAASPLAFVAVLAASLAYAGPARAADPCPAAPLVSTCINADTLWPHAGPQRFAGVGGVETDDSGRFGFGLVTDYLSRPIVFHVPSPGPNGSDQYAIDNQVNGTFLWSYGLTRRLELDFALPVTFGQTGTGAAPITGSSTPLHDTALRDLRFGAAYQLVPREPSGRTKLWGLTARFEMSAPTGDRDQLASDGTAVYVPSLAADFRHERFFAGLEIGARIRPNTQILGATVGPQGIVGLGIGSNLLPRYDLLSVMIEARSLPTFATQYVASQTAEGIVEQSSGSFLAPSEWMLSVRSAPFANGNLAITAGGGGALTTGDGSFTTPRFRFLLGVRYAPSEGDRDRDRDGIPDARDSCPRDPGPAPGGCPPGVTPARPIAHLDLARAPDVCKDEPDSADGFKDDDGCPDEDADKDGIDDRYDRCPLESEDFAGLPDGCAEKKSPPKP